MPRAFSRQKFEQFPSFLACLSKHVGSEVADFVADAFCSTESSAQFWSARRRAFHDSPAGLLEESFGLLGQNGEPLS